MPPPFHPMNLQRSKLIIHPREELDRWVVYECFEFVTELYGDLKTSCVLERSCRMSDVE